MFCVISDPKHLPRVWDRCKELLTDIADKESILSNLNLEEIRESLLRRYTFLLLDIDGKETIISLAIIDFLQYPKKRSLRVLYTAGQITGDWPNHFERIEQFARKYSVDFVELWGRPGWGKIMSKYGYKTKVVNMVKEL